MPERDPTYIGRVRRVIGSAVTIELDPSLAGVAPIYMGQLQSIGQVGTLVRLPQGMIDLIATVTLVGVAEGVSGGDDATGDRWLEVQLLGEVSRGTGAFQRGVGTYPGLDDPAHFALADELAALFPEEGEAHIGVGRLASSEQISVTLNLAKLVVRHAAVVGSTGAGKTSAVASLLQKVAGGTWPSANVMVVDVHGEYTNALGGSASVRSVLGAGDSRLNVPYWALSADAILRAFTGSSGGATAAKAFATLVAKERQKFAVACSWLTIDPNAVTADTPIPFDIRAVWLQFDSDNRETLVQDRSASTMTHPGDAQTLTPATFLPHGPGSQPPHQGPSYGNYQNVPELLRLGLQDPRLEFLQAPLGQLTGEDPLPSVVSSWLGDDKPVSVLDFNGVPDEAAGLAIGVVLSLLFEVATRTPNEGPGIGRPRPVLIVLEEAHRYLGESAPPVARDAANKIAREGRKYGVGLMLVTQRPSELPDTALAQCGTLIALRLSNSSDQGKIRSALPDSVSGLAEALPSLRTGEAIISGEALNLPARVLIDSPSPRPLADDPAIDSWTKAATKPDLAPAIARWRGTYGGQT